jgi:hypothetical protein
MYIDWDENPVLTTVETSALDVKEIPFPAVTICSNGYYQPGILNALLEKWLIFMAECGPTQQEVCLV